MFTGKSQLFKNKKCIGKKSLNWQAVFHLIYFSHKQGNYFQYSILGLYYFGVFGSTDQISHKLFVNYGVTGVDIEQIWGEILCFGLFVWIA